MNKFIRLKFSSPRLFHALMSFCGFLLCGGLLVFAEPFSHIGSMDDDKLKPKGHLSKQSIQLERLAKEAGKFSWKGVLDYTMGGVDPVTGEVGSKFIPISGTVDSQMVFGNKILLRRSTSSGSPFLTYHFDSYRTDLNQYFSISLDPNQTAIAYRSGNYQEGDRVLRDYTGYVKEKINFDTETRTLSAEVFLGESNTPFIRISQEEIRGQVKDLMKEILTSKLNQNRINKSKASGNPAENYSDEHSLLLKFFGNYGDPEGNEKPRISRLLAGGRFLSTVSLSVEDFLEPDSISIMGFDSRRGVFQMFILESDSPNPRYLEGDFDGIVLRFRDPFAQEKDRSNPVLTYTFNEKPGYVEESFESGKKVVTHFVPLKSMKKKR